MRKILAIWALLLLAIFAEGQIVSSAAAGQQNSAQMMGFPVLTGPTITFPAPTGGLILQSGYATTAGWGYPPLLATPTASFSTLSANPVGATDATSNLQVGASNSTVDNVSVPAPAVQTGIAISQPGAVTIASAPAQTGLLPGSSAGAGAGLGAAQFDVVSARAPGETRSVAEVARNLRQKAKPAPVRTFTNADVQRLKDQEQAAPQNP
jgi:hypothetical protein